MSVNYTAADVISIAKAEVGYLEKKTGELQYLYDKTANSGYNNFTKFAYEIFTQTSMYNGDKNGYAWCDAFVDWCHYQAAKLTGGDWHDAQYCLCQADNGAGAGCEYSYQYYKNYGRVSEYPSIGAQIFFLSGGEICHTGLVYAYDDDYVYTIEGNTSGYAGVVANGGAVCTKKYLRRSDYVYGYGLPRYADASDDIVIDDDDNSNDEVMDVIAKYKNGSTDEICYCDSKLTDRTGSLNPYEECDCLGRTSDGSYIVLYDHDGCGCKKIGFVEYDGGVGF